MSRVTTALSRIVSTSLNRLAWLRTVCDMTSEGRPWRAGHLPEGEENMLVLGVPDEVADRPGQRWPRRVFVIIVVMWISWSLLTAQVSALASLLTAATGLLLVWNQAVTISRGARSA